MLIAHGPMKMLVVVLLVLVVAGISLMILFHGNTSPTSQWPTILSAYPDDTVTEEEYPTALGSFDLLLLSFARVWICVRHNL